MMTASQAHAEPLLRDGWRRRVAHAFNRAAPHYTERANAQQVMGSALWSRLPGQAERVLDLGCGPGHWTARLSRRYATIALGVDLAPGMLTQAHRRHGDHARWLCADAACLPLAPRSQDLVFSNLAIQWCPDQAAVMHELYRILTPGGRALINTLGPGTLAEVDYAWSRPGRPASVLDFLAPETLRRFAHQAGFRNVRLDAAPERFFYPDLAAVMNSIKGVGAQLAPNRPRAPLTRNDLARAAQRFETLREGHGLPVTYQRLTLTLSR
ncbi:methyltransferase domain-containing protein [Litchfieldella rifensis]|uniref:Methyltransferase domain-containing protein n=1 Tax=Litchfieldella rifensis TaxID=762643 RepID=A0ABV7LWR6_9GAMM